MANPRPALWPVLVAIATFMPIIRPLVSSSGPPELPGFMAASVWMIDFISRPVRLGSVRLRLEMMPVVSVPSRPNGLPSVYTRWPTRRLSEVPIGTGIQLLGRGVDFEHGDVVFRVGADQFAVVGLLAAWKRDLDLVWRPRRRGNS